MGDESKGVGDGANAQAEQTNQEQLLDDKTDTGKGPEDLVMENDQQGFLAETPEHELKNAAESDLTPVDSMGPAVTLMEVEPGIAMVYGEKVPTDLELIGFDSVPLFDVAQISKALSATGDASTIAGNVGQLLSQAHGLFRVTNKTFSLMNQPGVQMASKGGAKLGTLMKDGQIIAQARFIPITVTPSTVLAAAGAIGPALALMGIQLMVDKATRLMRENLEVSNQILQTLQKDAQARFSALEQEVDGAWKDTCKQKTVNKTTWDKVSYLSLEITNQWKTYSSKVHNYRQGIRNLNRSKIPEFLETNSQDMVFSVYASVRWLSVYTKFQTMRALVALDRSKDDPSEKSTFESIRSDTPKELETFSSEVNDLVFQLTRELWMRAHSSEKVLDSLKRKQKDVKVRWTVLLQQIEPLAKQLGLGAIVPDDLKLICPPEDLDVPHFKDGLRWLLGQDQTVQAVAFPYKETGLKKLVTNSVREKGEIQEEELSQESAGIKGLLDKVGSGIKVPLHKVSATIEKKLPRTCVAVTDQQIRVSPVDQVRHEGEFSQIYELTQVDYLRGPMDFNRDADPMIRMVVNGVDDEIEWAFPADADSGEINRFAQIIKDGKDQLHHQPALLSPEPADEDPAHHDEQLARQQKIDKTPA